jgi:colanic acid biosynthesis glycosyl transferase WcaI
MGWIDEEGQTNFQFALNYRCRYGYGVRGYSKVRILIVSQFFGSDTAAVGQFVADVANGASEAGHGVLVVCGDDRYGIRESVRWTDIRNSPSETIRFCDGRLQKGALLVSCVRNLPFSHYKARKLMSYASFFAGATWKALTGPKVDVILTLTAPPGLAWIGWLMQRVRGCRHVVWEMDVYPDIAVALGMPLACLLAEVLDYPRRRADVVIVLGDCMKERLLQHQIPRERIFVAENWADGQEIYPLPFPEGPQLRILYSGNLGLAHEIATIRGVIEGLAGDLGFRFDFVGGGPQRKDLDDSCRRRAIGNTSFRPYVRHEDLGTSLAECHIGLVTQKAETLGAVVPSKVYGLMAAGRPFLYIGPAAATPALLIRRFDCGWHYECGDVGGVLGLLRYLQVHPEEIRAKGDHARKAFADHYDKPAGVARICRALGLEVPDMCPDKLIPSPQSNRNSQVDGVA